MSEVLPSDLKQRAAERAAQRDRLRVAYQRIYNNPFRTNSAIFDPAGLRYEAARGYMRYFYKFTPRSIAIPLALLGSMVGLQIHLNEQRDQKENEIRNGERSYFERAKYAAKTLY